MDKKLILAAAGSGKSSYIVNNILKDKRYLIITYTNNNYANLIKKIADKIEGGWPDNVTIMTYFQFLFRFCYKPFLSDEIGARGIIYENNPSTIVKQDNINYYLTRERYFYSNRLSFFLEKYGVVEEIKQRIGAYYDEFIIDEVQDIAGRDFNFLEKLMSANVNILFVGDFYQHTFDTSRDGNVNKSLFNDQSTYERRFNQKGISSDITTLRKSWRCSKNICNFISENLGIDISSNNTDSLGEVSYITDKERKMEIVNNPMIIKLHFRESHKYGQGHKNWGETKGEDCYQDVCVMLNKETMRKYSAGKLSELAPSTRNKLYVAITRAHGNVYLIEE